MPNPSGADPFPSSRVFLDRALDSARGIKVYFDNPRQAFRTRMNCYTVISRDREQTKKIYEETDDRYGRSPYDLLTIHLEDEDGNRVTNFNRDESALLSVRWLVIAKNEIPTDTIVEEL